MRLLAINQCRAGMRLAKPIFDEIGRVLLGSNVELSQSLLKRLGDRGIDYLYIQDPMTDDIEIPEMLDERTRIQALSQIRGTFRKVLDQPVPPKNERDYLQISGFRNVMHMIIDDLSQHNIAMIMLNDIGITDNYLYRHSLNVCIFATMLGMFQGFSRDDLFKIGLGALLHDIGKTRIPQEILKKPGKLTDSEFEEMKQHTVIGYRMLKDEPNFPLLSAHCALQHHERLDGSGYPRQLRSDEIHEFAKWLGVVDSYDAMTSHRVYRRAMLPHEAVEVLFSGAGKLFDIQKLELFRDKIAIYPLGLMVTLHNGESGVVVRIHPQIPQRPVVRVLYTPEGELLRNPYEIDLSRELSQMIVNINEIKAEMFLN